MYGIFTYMWLIFMVKVGKYTIHGPMGIEYRYIYKKYGQDVASSGFKARAEVCHALPNDDG